MELLPCPFCGGEGEYDFNGNDYVTYQYITCNGCGVSTAQQLQTKEQAAVMWNTRANKQEER